MTLQLVNTHLEILITGVITFSLFFYDFVACTPLICFFPVVFNAMA